MNKLERALKVADDLRNLQFIYNGHTLKHPNGNYEVWVANGFWFISLHRVGGQRPGYLEKFGAIGKILVWIACIPAVKRGKNLRDKECAKYFS